MKAYPAEQISDEELSLLVRWLTGDYLPTKVEDYPNRLEELAATVGQQPEGSQPKEVSADDAATEESATTEPAAADPAGE